VNPQELINRINELKQERARLVEQNRTVLDEFHESRSEGETWSSSEKREEYEKRFARVKAITEEVETLEAQLEQERRTELGGEDPAGPRSGHAAPDGGAGESRDSLPELFRGRREEDLSASERRALEMYRDYGPHFRDRTLDGADLGAYGRAFRSYLAHGREGLSAEDARALSAGTDAEGGFTVPPNFVAQLIKAVDDMVFVRRFATVFPLTTGDSMGAPSLDADPADADWTTELATGAEDAAMAFGTRALEPIPLAKRIKVSRKLLRASALNVEALVRDRLAYKFAVSQEKGFLTGGGVTDPLGLFTADANGITAARDVSAGNTTTAITMDGLKNAKWSLKGGYLRNARWMFHRDALAMIDKLRTEDGGAGTGMYLWQPSVQAGEPDRLLNLPVHMSEYVPSTFTTGLYVGILGDFSYYWIADALNMIVQRLVELYAETNQIGFIGRLETDGAPVLEEAFTRVTLA